MNKFKLVFVTFALTLTCSVAQAQFGTRLGSAVKNAAENAAVRKAEQKTDEAVSKSIDKATNPDSYKEEEKEAKQKQPQEQQGQEQPPTSSKGGNVKAPQAPQQNEKALEMTYAKSDFVAGDEIIFDDNLSGEKLGEFPSMWDLLNGVVEVASYGGVKAIHFEVPSAGVIVPLMKNMKNYLPDVFTIEFDFWVNDPKKEPKDDQQYRLYFRNTNKDWIADLIFADFAYTGGLNMVFSYKSASGDDNRSASADNVAYVKNAWNHLSVSFNKRAFKAYVNGIRIINVPAMTAPNNFEVHQTHWGGFSGNRNAITNIRLAKGAVPLYDRMMSAGKFITYGITFDVGKSTIKPESMGEINRIVTLMKENPELKFSVEGHTDNTGNAANNQTLSEARSQAVVDKLVENGIARDRLKAAGKGQTAPISDNATDEGRAKNRRVEFVKI